MPSEVTQLPAEIRNGNNDAEGRLGPMAYDGLHQMAARYMNRERLGHTLQTTILVDLVVFSEDKCDELIAVDRALSRLAARDARLGRIIELKFFAGMTEEEIGEVLGKSACQIEREWRVAKVWLQGELSACKSDDDGTMAADQDDNR
jgi:ECF sigma factor